MVCFGHFNGSFSMALLVKLVYLQLLTTLTSSVWIPDLNFSKMFYVRVISRGYRVKAHTDRQGHVFLWKITFINNSGRLNFSSLPG